LRSRLMMISSKRLYRVKECGFSGEWEANSLSVRSDSVTWTLVSHLLFEWLTK
jgi:hypothetical protein